MSVPDTKSHVLKTYNSVLLFLATLATQGLVGMFWLWQQSRRINRLVARYPIDQRFLLVCLGATTIANVVFWTSILGDHDGMFWDVAGSWSFGLSISLLGLGSLQMRARLLYLDTCRDTAKHPKPLYISAISTILLVPAHLQWIINRYRERFETGQPTLRNHPPLQDVGRLGWGCGLAIPILVPAVFGLAALVILLLHASGAWMQDRALLAIEAEVGALDPQRFVYEAQRPHPLLSVAATTELTSDERLLLKDWVDEISPEVLEEFLNLSVMEDGFVFRRCAPTRKNLDWALERVSGHFGIDYLAFGSEPPLGYNRVPSLIRLIFLCGWTAQREGDLESAALDAKRLGDIATILYAEPGPTELFRGALAENSQHRLVRQILAQGPYPAPWSRLLLDSLPTGDLHQSYRDVMAIEAMMVINDAATVMEDLGLSEGNDEAGKSWTERYFETVFLLQAEGGGLTWIKRYLAAYEASYGEMQDALTLHSDEMKFIEKVQALLGPSDWRFPAIPRWIEDHRRLSRALLLAAAKRRDAAQPCREVRQQMGDLLKRFEAIDEAEGCRVHYVYGEDYLWPSKVRAVKNPVGDWWLPAG